MERREQPRRPVCCRMCDVTICNLTHIHTTLPDRGGNLIDLLSTCSIRLVEKRVFETLQLLSHPSCEIRLTKAQKMKPKRHEMSGAALFMVIRTNPLERK